MYSIGLEGILVSDARQRNRKACIHLLLHVRRHAAAAIRTHVGREGGQRKFWKSMFIFSTLGKML